jgi:hypothetical protein
MDPGTFVNALAWDQLRREVAQRENKPFRSRSRSAQRDPALAAVWSCLEGEAMKSVTPGEAYQIVVQDLGDTSSYDSFEPSALDSLATQLECMAVDTCFEHCDPWLLNDETFTSSSESEYDQELELLESVQQISLEIQSGIQRKRAEESSCIIQATESQAEGQSV